MALTPSHRNQVFTGVGHVVDENIEYSERPGKNHRKEAGRLEPCSNGLLAGKLCLSPGRHSVCCHSAPSSALEDTCIL